MRNWTVVKGMHGRKDTIQWLMIWFKIYILHFTYTFNIHSKRTFCSLRDIWSYENPFWISRLTILLKMIAKNRINRLNESIRWMVITVKQGTPWKLRKTKQAKQENGNVKFAFKWVYECDSNNFRFWNWFVRCPLSVGRLINISFHIPAGWSVNNRCWSQILVEFRIISVEFN